MTTLEQLKADLLKSGQVATNETARHLLEFMRRLAEEVPTPAVDTRETIKLRSQMTDLEARVTWLNSENMRLDALLQRIKLAFKFEGSMIELANFIEQRPK